MTRLTVEAVWPHVERRLRDRYGSDSAIDRWLSMVRPLGDDGATVSLGVPNGFVLGWVERKYHAGLVEILRAELRREVRVRLAIAPALFGGAERSPPAAAGGAGPPRNAPRAPDTSSGARRGPRKRAGMHSLGGFIVGDCNRSAFGAVSRLLDQPLDAESSPFNPLVVFGSTGVGKTHLLRGVHTELGASGPALKVRYVPAEKFVSSFVWSIQQGTVSRFRDGMRGLDVLVFDDFQYLVGKEKSQEEFLHTFDSLLNSGSRIVVGSSRHPREVEGIDSALVSRLLSGLVVPLSLPEHATRLEILRRHASRFESPIPDELLQLVAERVRGSARELLGAANQVSAHMQLARASGSPVDVRRLAESIDDVFRPRPRRLHMDRVLDVVSRFYSVSRERVASLRRGPSLVRARQVAIYLCRRYTHHSLAEISDFFNRKSASTIGATARRVERLIESGDPIRREVREIREILDSA